MESARREVHSAGAAEALRALPSIDELAARLAALPDLKGCARAGLVALARELAAAMRDAAGDGRVSADAVAAALRDDALRALAARHAAGTTDPYHARVLNGTGVVLHTGIGRAPLAPAAVAAMVEAAGVARVEVDAVTGARGRREDAVEGLLRALTRAQAGLVVNNNAAACVLGLAALARGRDVIVSRGELVEIGGSFRMPDVMASAGCRLVEVGTTNRTYLRDYEGAITPETGLLLKVHPSNFRVVGFTESTPLDELVALGQRSGVPVMEDLGSGLLAAASIPALKDEPRVVDSVATGADLVTFSGDKLLGGPQAGIIVGRKAALAQLRQHPLYRAFRLDKTILAALEATLRVYRDGDPVRELPTLLRIAEPVAAVRARAERLLASLGAAAGALFARVVDSEAWAGSGSNPARPIASCAVALRPADDPERFAQRLRLQRPPLFTRVQLDQVMVDARTLADDEIELAARHVADAALTEGS